MRIAQGLDGIVSTEDGAAIMLARGAASEPDAYDNGGYCGDDENGDHDNPFVVLVYPASVVSEQGLVTSVAGKPNQDGGLLDLFPPLAWEEEAVAVEVEEVPVAVGAGAAAACGFAQSD
jgi:hypothetical protein